MSGRAVAGLPVPPSPVRCQACSSPLRPGLRLCLSCGRAAIQFTRSEAAEHQAFAVDLLQAKDTEVFLRRLRAFLELVADGKVPDLNFLTGDARWYSKEEQERHIKLPVRLLGGVSEKTAREIASRLEAEGMKVEARSPERLAQRRHRAGIAFWSSIGAALAGGAATIGTPLIAVFLAGGAVAAVASGIIRYGARPPAAGPLVELQRAPVALPASDALVVRLGVLFAGAAPDVADILSDVALSVQRLVDRRAEGLADAAALELATRPVAELVAIIEKIVTTLAALDADLATLDEGVLVRALAASEARGEPKSRRVDLLEGLDRLRTREDERARHVSRLLEAAGLLEQAVGLALTGRDEGGDHDRHVRLALASLSSDGTGQGSLSG